MAQNLTVLKYAAQAQLQDTFTATLYTDVYVKAPNTLVGLLDKQRSNIRPVMDSTNTKKCNGYEIDGYTHRKCDNVTLSKKQQITKACQKGWKNKFKVD